MPIPYKDLPLKEVKELLEKLPPNVKIRVYYDSEEGQVVDIVRRNRHKPTLSQRMSQLEELIVKLTETVADGFAELRQDIKDIKVRLDNVEKRLDNVEARLDNVEKRLDYNDLKPLPNATSK